MSIVCYLFSFLLKAIGVKAVVELKALSEEGVPVEGPHGVLTLEQMTNGVRIMGSIMGLSQGMHGFHIHDKGDLRMGCGSAGPHFNPYMVQYTYTILNIILLRK